MMVDTLDECAWRRATRCWMAAQPARQNADPSMPGWFSALSDHHDRTTLELSRERMTNESLLCVGHDVFYDEDISDLGSRRAGQGNLGKLRVYRREGTLEQSARNNKIAHPRNKRIDKRNGRLTDDQVS